MRRQKETHSTHPTNWWTCNSYYFEVSIIITMLIFLQCRRAVRYDIVYLFFCRVANYGKSITHPLTVKRKFNIQGMISKNNHSKYIFALNKRRCYTWPHYFTKQIHKKVSLCSTNEKNLNTNLLVIWTKTMHHEQLSLNLPCVHCHWLSCRWPTRLLDTTIKQMTKIFAGTQQKTTVINDWDFIDMSSTAISDWVQALQATKNIRN